MKDLKFKVHWSFFLLGILMIIFGRFQIFLLSLLCIILHEMGHSFVGRRLGYKLNVITLLPYGAMLSGSKMPFSEDDEIKIAIAGPIVNAVLIIVSVALWWLFPVLYTFTYDFVMVNIFDLCFNLLPVYPLDGGRILLAILSKKTSRKRAGKITKIIGFVVTGLVFALFFISFFFKLNYMLGINALFLLIGLFGDDANIYYEKLSTFNSFKSPIKNVKIAKIGSNSSIFDAYKQVVEDNATTFIVERDNKEVAKLSQREILQNILTKPLNTTIDELILSKSK